MAEKSLKPITNFIFELGILKKFKHCGTYFAGVDNPDSVAEHVFRAAQIGLILAKIEKSKHPEKIALMCLIHDNAESRIGDQHKVILNYLAKEDLDDAEEKACYDQLKSLPKNIGTFFWDLYEEFIEQASKESKIAKDADYLETAFQAKEYLDLGHESCQTWINNIEKVLQTESAKKILASMQRTKFTDWWNGLR